jgi:hypothetical protein
MPGARSGPNDNLRLIAATAILVLTAQHFFQPGAKIFFSPEQKLVPPEN